MQLFLGILWHVWASSGFAYCFFFLLQCQVILETPVCQASQALKEMKASRACLALLAALAYQLYQVKEANPPLAQIGPLPTLVPSSLFHTSGLGTYLVSRRKVGYSQSVAHCLPKATVYEVSAWVSSFPLASVMCHS